MQQKKCKVCTLKTETMLKEIKADLNKWNNILSSWIKIFHAVKMEMLPKLI